MGAAKADLEERYRTDDRYRTTSTDTTTDTTAEESRSRHIKDEIDHTRGEMDQTLNALSDRLSPRHLLDQVIDIFRSPSGTSTRDTTETLRQVGNRVATQVRRHPVPSLLFTAGVAWMIFAEEGEEKGRHHEPLGWDSGPPATTEHAGHFVDARTGQPYDESYGHEYWEEESQKEHAGEKSWSDTAREAGATASGAAQRVREAGASIAHTASEAAHRVREATGRARETTGRAREGMSQMGERAGRYRRDFQGRARDFGHQMQHGMQHGRESFSRGIHEYPMAAGAAAAAVGLLAGLFMPRTRTEDELMGEQAERVKEQVRSTAGEAYERGKEVVRQTASAAAEEAERQGLMPEQLAEKASQVAAAAQEEAKHKTSEEAGPLHEKVQQVTGESHTTPEGAERHQEEMAR